MKNLFTLEVQDQAFYRDYIESLLPEKLIDIHTHIWKDRFRYHGQGEFDRVVSWPSRVALDNPIEDLEETYRLLFPGKSVFPLLFAEASPRDNLDELNRYVLDARQSRGYPALLFASPQWPAEDLDRRLEEGRWAGVKVYLSFAPSHLAEEDIGIFDFLTPSHLDALNRRGLMAMLHIPRPGRLRDPLNLAQLLEIEERYPSLKLVVAHAGRAYCQEDLGNALEQLSRTKRMVFDFSANTNAVVFRRFLETLGPRRCLFGSDLPITRMRMDRYCRDGLYINRVPRGLYGDVSGDSHMEEVEGERAKELTFFLYQEVRAILEACTALGFGPQERSMIFYDNAARLLSQES